MIRTILIRTLSGGKFDIKGYHNYYLGLYDFPCTPAGRQELLTEKYRKRAGNKCEKPCSDKCEKSCSDKHRSSVALYIKKSRGISGRDAPKRADLLKLNMKYLNI